MKIIDAHLHIFPSEPRTDAMAEKVGHVNSIDHLREVYGQLDIVHGVVMGNRSLDVGFIITPPTCFTTASGWTAWCWTGARPSPRTCPTRWRST